MKFAKNASTFLKITLHVSDLHLEGNSYHRYTYKRMSELNRAGSESKMDELRDGPQPGFRRYTEEDLKELRAQDEAHLDLLAKGLVDKKENAARNIGHNIILGYN